RQIRCKFVERLKTELHSTETNLLIALLLRRVELTQGEHGLSVALLVERDGGAKAARVVVAVGAVLENDEFWSFHFQKHHAIVISRPVGAVEYATPPAADAHGYLPSPQRQPLRSNPPADVLRLRPGLQHHVTRRIEHPRNHNFPVPCPLWFGARLAHEVSSFNYLQS